MQPVVDGGHYARWRARSVSGILSGMQAITRKRRFFKWTGLVACVVLVGLMAVSREWIFGWQGHTWNANFCWSAFAVGYDDSADTPVALGWFASRDLKPDSILWFLVHAGSNDAWILILLWFPLTVIGVPTLLAWRRDRRVPPGHCRKCRYDLTGNESGVCPECGTAVKKP